MDIHAVGRGVATRNKRRACSRALRSHRPRVHELYAVSGQTVRIGGVYILVAVTTELVSAGIFEGEPKDIGPFVFLLSAASAWAVCNPQKAVHINRGKFFMLYQFLLTVAKVGHSRGIHAFLCTKCCQYCFYRLIFDKFSGI